MTSLKDAWERYAIVKLGVSFTDRGWRMQADHSGCYELIVRAHPRTDFDFETLGKAVRDGILGEPVYSNGFTTLAYRIL